ncbi:MAG TPA: hypothetical protein VLD65_01270 [Anaerolineales bacterium]|nr:hypothetical protein [Anaerolineales bacterium]
MNKILTLRPRWLWLIFILLDTICVGMGMGLPIFCILFGFIVGWFLAKSITITNTDILQVLRNVLRYASLTAGVTCAEMLILWLPFASYLFDPTKDLTKMGIPMILYQPRESAIGWIVLMVLISPSLQLLTTLFGAYLTIITTMKKGLA